MYHVVNKCQFIYVRNTKRLGKKISEFRKNVTSLKKSLLLNLDCIEHTLAMLKEGLETYPLKILKRFLKHLEYQQQNYLINMQPIKKFITINKNLDKIKQLLNELVLQPRLNAIKWSLITKQTPNIKIGYPGQHLASLITGMEGERTGARGNDLIDGSEVKSCSRIDQLDMCKKCKSPVARLETVCSNCNSSDIDRKNDSKWLFSIRNKNED